MGVTPAQIAEMDKADTTVKLEDLTAAVSAHQRTLLQNDNEFINPIRTKTKGEVHDLYSRAFKKFGLKPEELVDDKGEAKKPEEIVKILADKGNEGKDKTLLDLQNENMALKTKVQNYEDVEIPKIKSEVETEKKKFVIREKFIKKLSAVGELRNPIEVVEAALGIDFGKKGYIIEEDDKGELIFKGKDGLGIKNAQGTALLTADEIITDSLKTNKFIAESNPPDPNKPPIKPDPKITEPKPEDKNKNFSPGLSKAEQHLVEMKKKEPAK